MCCRSVNWGGNEGCDNGVAQDIQGEGCEGRRGREPGWSKRPSHERAACVGKAVQRIEGRALSAESTQREKTRGDGNGVRETPVERGGTRHASASQRVSAVSKAVCGRRESTHRHRDTLVRGLSANVNLGWGQGGSDRAQAREARAKTSEMTIRQQSCREIVFSYF